jgi:hypothetical protein
MVVPKVILSLALIRDCEPGVVGVDSERTTVAIYERDNRGGIAVRLSAEILNLEIDVYGHSGVCGARAVDLENCY